MIAALTPGDVTRVLRRFYTDVQRDPVLGPVFAAHVADWDSHIDKIAAFWRNVLFHERTYSGNPMQAHLAAGNVKSEHFAIWLDLFDATLSTELPIEVAAQWSLLAHRIGRSLKSGVLLHHSRHGAPPLLG